ncbi:hypothetical protein JZ751_016335, partial [Albula glossodonta]
MMGFGVGPEYCEVLCLCGQVEEVVGAHQCWTGILAFICELIKLKLLTEVLMHDRINNMLKNRNEDSLEGVCCLLSSIDKTSTMKARPHVDQCYRLLENIIEQGEASSRTCCMVEKSKLQHSVFESSSAVSEKMDPDALHSSPVMMTGVKYHSQDEKSEYLYQTVEQKPSAPASQSAEGQSSAQRESLWKRTSLLFISLWIITLISLITTLGLYYTQSFVVQREVQEQQRNSSAHNT